MPALATLARRRSLRVGTPLALVAVLVVYLVAIWPWMIAWGTTPRERDGPLPGDELVASATDQSTRAITVHAPAAETWRWLVQIGEDRAGFYSYDWLENLFGARIANGDRVRAEWQTLRVGDVVRAVPPGYLGDRLDPPGWRVAAVAPGHWFVLRNWGVFLVRPVNDSTSRVIVRTRFHDETWWGPVVTRLAFGPVHFVMERQMLRGIARRAEGRRRPVAPDLVASVGWALAATMVVRALARRRRWVGLALPLLLALWVLRGTGDAIAAAAGLTALGLVALGAPRLRRLWPVLLPVPAVVLLVLLFAPDAFVAFGVGFAALAVAASGGAWLSSRRGAAVPRAPLPPRAGPAPA